MKKANKRNMLFVSNKDNDILKKHKTIRNVKCKESKRIAMIDISNYCTETDSLWNRNFVAYESIYLTFINLNNYVEINLHYNI